MLNLSDFYLVRCFDVQEYRDSFNRGNLFCNSTEYYWNLENAFQQDYEGSVFRQTGRGYLIVANSQFRTILQKSHTLKEVIENLGEHGRIINETAHFNVRVSGYLLCFFLLAKKDVKIDNGTFAFTSLGAKQALIKCFNEYTKGKSSLFPCLYDAQRLFEGLDNHFKQSNFQLVCGDVEYRDLGDKEKIAAFNTGDVKTIIFTKPLSYSYQREFRFFICPKIGPVDKYLCEPGIDIASSVIGTINYTCDTGKMYLDFHQGQ